MSTTQVDTVTKLSYLLPTGTFLTFQVLAPLTTNNGHCGRTEQILTAVTLAILVCGCIVTSLTDSYIDLDGKLHTGVLTPKGLWVLGQGLKKIAEQEDGNSSMHWHSELFKPLKMDIITALLSAVAFLTLTMFTDPVSSCFYPHLSETVLKSLPVLLATVLSFCSSFLTKIRHGYGNSVPHPPPAEEETGGANSAADGATQPTVNSV